MRLLNSCEAQTVSGSFGPIIGGLLGGSAISTALYYSGHMQNFPSTLLIWTGVAIGVEIGDYLSPDYFGTIFEEVEG